MAYGGLPLTVPRDAARLLVGDVSTSTGSEFLSNVDYDYFIGTTSNTYLAAAMAANSLAALFSGAAASASGSGWTEKKVGDLVIKRGEAASLADDYRSLADWLRQQAAAGASPYAGGISASDKRAVEQDTDRVRPAFAKRLFDSLQALDIGRTSDLST